MLSATVADSTTAKRENDEVFKLIDEANAKFNPEPAFIETLPIDAIHYIKKN